MSAAALAATADIRPLAEEAISCGLSLVSAP